MSYTRIDTKRKMKDPNTYLTRQGLRNLNLIGPKPPVVREPIDPGSVKQSMAVSEAEQKAKERKLLEAMMVPGDLMFGDG